MNTVTHYDRYKNSISKGDRDTMIESSQKVWVEVSPGKWKEKMISVVKNRRIKSKLSNKNKIRKSKKIRIRDEKLKLAKQIEDKRELVEKRKSSEPSKYEKIIIEFLKKNDVDFIREYFRNDLKNPRTGKLLFFDFYLPDYNYIIEFDGIQHYKPGKDKNNLKLIQFRDNCKTKYCERKGINLLRIPYWKGSMLNDYLKEWFSSIQQKGPGVETQARVRRMKPTII